MIPRNPSAEFIRLNPHLFPRVTTSQAPAIVNPKAASKIRTMSAPALNKTEQRWQDAHPAHIPFPLRLRWGKCMWYEPDFIVQDSEDRQLIEVKGAHIFDRDIVRFKGCAAEWSWLFSFEMWQWKDRQWTRIY